MEDRTESVAGFAAEILFQNLISLCKEEISLIRKFKDDLDKLKESLEMTRDFLNAAEKKQGTSDVKHWLIKLDDVAFDADNVLDELNYEVHRRKMGTGNNLKKKVRAHFSIGRMGREIRSINEKLKSINQEAERVGLERQSSSHVPSVGPNPSLFPPQKRNPSLLVRGPDASPLDLIVGRESDVSSILKILTAHGEQEVFSILPIVGMGGLGKTALARLVFNHRIINAHFDVLFWVYVGESFDEAVILKTILQSISGSSYDDFKSKEALMRELQNNLKAKRYLLVLDDVWTEDKQKWNDFVNSLWRITSAKGNDIIVTTRSKNLASVVGATHIHELKGLSAGDCWWIIKGMAFGEGNVIPSEFEGIGIEIAKKCEGSPLAAKVMGGFLREKSMEEWRSIKDSKFSNMGEDGNTQRSILKLSLDNLSSQSLKKCFAFCAILPRGYQIQKHVLIHLWMAEGFLQSDDMETLGDKYFDILRQNSLLQVGEQFPDGRIAYYTMQNVMYDLASSVLNESGPVRCIYTKSITDIPKEKARTIRSLIFAGRIFDENMLSDFKYLRGLVLIGYDNTQLPKIEHLTHLRYLDIFVTSIGCSPKLISKLYLLQAFRARIASKELPEALKKLIKLRHVYVEGIGETGAETQLGRGLVASPRLENQELRLSQKPTSATRHFPNLKTLYIRGMYSSSLLENLLVSITSLKELQFEHLPGPVYLPEVLFHNNQNLTYLKICLCRKIDLPPRFGVSLREIEIDCCLEQEGLPQNLHCLDKLLLRGCPNIKSIPYNPNDGSSSLRELKISYCGGLTELPIGLLELCSSSLEYVRLERLASVTNMGKVIACLQQMPHLSSLAVDLKHLANDDLPIEIVGTFYRLRELWISCGMEMWQHLQDHLQHLDALTKLTLFEIEMEAVPEWLGKLTSLWALQLDSCPKLRSLPSKEALECLKTLKVVSCPLLNLRGDDDNSEWHKVSDIAHVFQDQVLSSEQVKQRGAVTQKGPTKSSDISDQASTSWSTSREIKALQSENEKLKTEMTMLQRDYAELQQEHRKR